MERATQQATATPPLLEVGASLAGKTILLTGSTGFLAKVVLEKLIRSVPGVRIVLPIRAGEAGASARARFEREVASSSIFDTLRAEQPQLLQRCFAEQIECVTAELTRANLGLDASAYQELAARIDLVINTAASVNFREALDQALAINALSVRNLAALARAAQAPLVQVSTCYVNGYQRGEMRERVVDPAGTIIPRHPDGHYELAGVLRYLQRRIDQVKALAGTPEQQARRLTELGIFEANYHGWNDTYTFTKWMGEQLAMEAMQGRALTIVRPSIIESTLQEPVPGWIEGVKVADAIILAYARGKTTFFPARPDGVVDIVPADLVANGIVLAGAEALAARPAHRIYQACTGSRNPVRLGTAIELFQNEAQRHWRQYERLFYQEPKHRFRVVSRPVFLLMLRSMRLGLGLWSGARRLLGAGPAPRLEALRTTQMLALTFSFYTAPRYRFHNDSLMALAQRFSDYDQRRFAIDPALIDWPDYLGRVHMGGLNRYALRARAGRPQAASAANQAGAEPAASSSQAAAG